MKHTFPRRKIPVAEGWEGQHAEVSVSPANAERTEEVCLLRQLDDVLAVAENKVVESACCEARGGSTVQKGEHRRVGEGDARECVGRERDWRAERRGEVLERVRWR